jgi:hypothetical protein
VKRSGAKAGSGADTGEERPGRMTQTRHASGEGEGEDEVPGAGEERGAPAEQGHSSVSDVESPDLGRVIDRE